MNHPIRADKRLGQHFLRDESVIYRLLAAIRPQPGEALLEIGPGLGALTLPLLREIGQLTAIEYDTRLIAPLTARAAPLGELHLINADILDVDLGAIPPQPERWRLVGNLPYNLSSPILFHCLAARAHIADMHFMLQKEVVERITAAPGGKDYGRLSLMAQLWCDTAALFTIPPAAFAPPPKVDSAIVRLVPRATPTWMIDDEATFAATVSRAFNQRRKMLRHTFAAWFTSDELAALDIDPTARPETLDGAAYARLANAHYHKEQHP